MTDPRREEREGARVVTPMVIGMLLGVVVSSLTGAWWWVGVGLALGAAVGAIGADGGSSGPNGPS